MKTESQHKKRHVVWVFVLGTLLTILVVGTLYAAGESIVRQSVPAGGGIVSAAEVTLRDAIGVPLGGVVGDSSAMLCSGGNCPGAPSAPGTPSTPNGSPTPEGTPASQGRLWLPIVQGQQ